jgi:hypothetical protein
MGTATLSPIVWKWNGTWWYRITLFFTLSYIFQLIFFTITGFTIFPTCPLEFVYTADLGRPSVCPGQTWPHLFFFKKKNKNKKIKTIILFSNVKLHFLIIFRSLFDERPKKMISNCCQFYVKDSVFHYFLMKILF